ncbi:MAG: ATP-binding protein, partial [Anaerosomatales bacterium]|nr:ATP-binding protein [Anaerosomatales bacterium]
MSRVVNNTPSPMLLQKIGATNLTLADAIAEIVANSFDASVEGQASDIEVTVVPEADEISVVDSGTGMSEDVLAEAVRLGVDMSKVIDRKSGTKGHFGLGMKTACASIGKWWAVYTRPLGEDLEYRVEFDLEDWERRPNSPDAWTIVIDDVPKTAESPLGDRPYGTAVVVKKLRQRNPMPGPVTKKLGEAFKAHLEQGDRISVNGEPAEPKRYRFVPGSKVPVDLRCGVN